jgi:NADH dehydrogenase (ubiquinone) Fe-S protein 6
MTSLAGVSRKLDQTIAMFNRKAILQIGRRIIYRAESTSPSSKSISAANTNESSLTPQSPNYATPWSTNQRPRPAAASGPRFEQTVMELQPNPLSAMELIANQPVKVVHGRKAVCDGGGSQYFSTFFAGF